MQPLLAAVGRKPRGLAPSRAPSVPCGISMARGAINLGKRAQVSFHLFAVRRFVDDELHLVRIFRHQSSHHRRDMPVSLVSAAQGPARSTVGVELASFGLNDIKSQVTGK